jgi:hypothetical protein
MRLILFVALIAVLATTNPDEDAFGEFAEDIVAEEIGTRAEDLPAGGLLGELGGIAAGQLVRRYADRDNYVVASVYTLDLDGRAREEGDWRFLGIAGMFFELQRPESLQ